MGYACPVCDAEQADAAHLANHLAITASLGREDHREWLEDHAPDWGDRDPESLGEVVAEYAPEIETPEFEGGHGHGHDHGHGSPGRPDALEDGLARQTRQAGRGSLTSEAESVLREAQELTRRMHEDVDEVSEDGSSGTEDGNLEEGDDAGDGNDRTGDDA
ncbi:hypothetical protein CHINAEXTREME_06045 [Halobiforma lacisalsi AJ5]|uniref:Uncharacterized protein n=1 Tax=Natronobacterium lacisalsi AJ5 TaxID=358396 RepID=M0M0J1_NATLA|nr:DUF5810 domain-containing protein [Halobiforma lacisalsi]APW97355.1 hypothetical protein CHINAEXTREME_06045 [Halobiforma lacisalsi AJ5]EMA37895.1 hypothetical protein C445_00570 [Halobiforma lacisalsi AJ5]